MVFEEFYEQLKECKKMAEILDTEIVFHKLQGGLIFINKETGIFHFSDPLNNYIPSTRLTLDNVANLRWNAYYNEDDEDISESSITIHFNNGDFVHLYYWHALCNIEFTIHFQGEDAKDECERLSAVCKKRLLRFQHS